MTPENIELLEREGRGPLTSNIPEAGGFFRTRAGLRAPDIEFHYAPCCSTTRAWCRRTPTASASGRCC